MAAKLIGLKVSRVTLLPFGLNLKLKNRYIYGTAEEVILYLAGPFANILLALSGVAAVRIFGADAERWRWFYMCNIMLFAMNMLPVLPLDGGIILKKLLICRIGMKRTMFIMRSVTCFFIGIMAIAAIMAVNRNGVSYSFICLVIFLAGNILTQKEKYDTDFIKELVNYRSKRLGGRRAVVRVAGENEDMRKRAAEFTTGTYTVLLIVDGDGAVKEVITERQVIDSLLK